MAVDAKWRGKAPTGMLSGISPEVKVEKVDNTWGSTAGAGSDFFHIYRKQRYIEMNRLKTMDENYEKQKEQVEFEAERQRLKAYDEERTQKRREKRKRKQMNQRHRKLSKQAGGNAEMSTAASDTASQAQSGGAIAVG